MNSEFCKKGHSIPGLIKTCLHLGNNNPFTLEDKDAYFCKIRKFKLVFVSGTYIKPIGNFSCSEFELKERGLNYTDNKLRYDGNKRC